MSAMMFAKDSMHSPIIMINDHHDQWSSLSWQRRWWCSPRTPCTRLSASWSWLLPAAMMITIMATTVMLIMKFANNHVHSQISNNEEANPLELGARGWGCCSSGPGSSPPPRRPSQTPSNQYHNQYHQHHNRWCITYSSLATLLPISLILVLKLAISRTESAISPVAKFWTTLKVVDKLFNNLGLKVFNNLM